MTRGLSILVCNILCYLATALIEEASNSRLVPFLRVDLNTTAIDEAQAIIYDTYSSEIHESLISHHAFVRFSPSILQHSTSKLLWPPSMVSHLTSRYPNHILIPDTFDEIFIMRQEFDYLDKDKKHYDGILKLPFITTARSLSYICGPPARLFAATSRQHHTTWPSSAIMLDFNRELHYVQAITADATPRIMIKASLHILPANASRWRRYATVYSHRIVFFAIKSLRNSFEAASGNRFQQAILMLLDNCFRGFNKIHAALPLSLIGVAIGRLLVAPLLHQPLSFVPYIGTLVLLTQRRLPKICSWVSFATAVPCSFARMQFSTFNALQHVAWLVMLQWVEQNGKIARRLVFAPIPDPIQLVTNSTVPS